MKRLHLVLLIAVLLTAAVIVVGYRNATSDPVIRVAQLEVPGLDASRPFRVLFLSDTHVAGPDMPPGRLARIVTKLNGQRPDLVLLGGDYTGESLVETHGYSIEEAVRPFRGFRAPLGVVAVLGNHDLAAARTIPEALSSVGVTVLADEAQQFGPIAVGGIFNRPKRTARRLMRLDGAKILVAHMPDRILRIPPLGLPVLAGNTHCGQIVLPIVGPLDTGSALPNRYICGLHRVGGNLLIVTAGVGTSHVPLRFGAPPDAWLIILRPASVRAGSADRAARP